MVSLVLTPCFCENGLCWWSSNFADVAGYSRKKVGCFAFHFFCEYPVVAEKCGKSSIFHISCGRIAVFEVMSSCCRFGISLFAKAPLFYEKTSVTAPLQKEGWKYQPSSSLKQMLIVAYLLCRIKHCSAHTWQ